MVVRTQQRRRRLLFLLLALTVTSALFAPRAIFQSLNAQAGGVIGETINAITHGPVARVLVRCGTQAMLTGYQGEFHFDGDCTPASLSAFKPGYTLAEDALAAAAAASQTGLSEQASQTQPIQIPLYPEAVLTGSVSAPSGQPLPGILVNLSRSQYDESGHRWLPAGTARTNTHGEFRMTMPPGEYRLQTIYSVSQINRNASTVTNKQAVLPVAFPDISSTEGSGLLHLGGGEAQHIELHPQVVRVATVTATLEPTAGRTNISLMVHLAGGTRISVRPSPGANEGEVKFELPGGSYTVEATRRTQDGMEEAQTRITVGTTEPRGVQLRFAPVNPIAVEMTVAEPTSDNKAPSVAQLGLALINSDLNAEPEDETPRPVQRGQVAMFNPPAGSYRLRAQSGGAWYVLSATYGMSDLLRQDLVVSAGAAPATLRVVVSDQTASLAGSVRLADQPAGGYVYLIADTPSATPLTVLHTDTGGHYSRANVPPGSYRVLAFAHRHSINFEDPETVAAFSNAFRSVTVNAGDKATLDVDLTPWPESAR